MDDRSKAPSPRVTTGTRYWVTPDGLVHFVNPQEETPKGGRNGK